MKYNEILRAHEYYQCGASLSKTGKKFGQTRQMMHYFFKSIGLPTRPLKRGKTIVYNGDNYTKNSLGYWRKTNGDRELLHRQKWMDHNGPIPTGYNVHHKDEDKDNNEIDNFELLSVSEHSSLHGFTNNQFTKKNPDKYKHKKEVFCLECDINFWDDNRNPSYNIARIFCSQKCRSKHMKGKPQGYSVTRIIKIANGEIR